MGRPRSSGLPWIAKTLLLSVAYYGSAVLSLHLALVRGQVTPIWPPTGIALVALLLFGRRLWPGITLGALLVNLPISPSPVIALGIAAGNTLAPLFAATLLRKARFRPQLDRLRDAMAIVLLGALLGMTVSATGGTATLVLSGTIPRAAFLPTWSVWWAGDAMGVLIVAPFLLSLRASGGAHQAMAWPRRAEVAVVFAGLAVVAHLVFQSDLQIEYVVFPFLGWAAYRYSQRGAASAALLASGIAVWAAVRGTGPFAHASLFAKMVTLQVFNASAALVSFVLAAVVAEHLKDIAERERGEDELARRALHDPLTNLANRMLFMDRLSHALAGLDRRPGAVAVLFLDLDRFKVTNDSFGHEVGDQVLSIVAERVRSVLREGDTPSRFGGDEFVVLCENVEGERDAIRIAERMARAVGQPIRFDDGEVVVTTSMGIALARGSSDYPEGLVRDADAALYRAKEHGRNRYELFDEDMRVRAMRRLKTEDEVRRAIELGELRLHYQPVVRLEDGGIASVEALVRWAHPERGLLEPAGFIPVAEETGLIGPLGRWVLEEACRQLARWRADKPIRPDLTIAVNLSPRQLVLPDFEETVRRALSQAGVPGSRLCLEITESVLMETTPSTIDLLHRLRELGVRLAIDDFGTGYSSLGYLKRVQVDALKVDRSFVQGLGADPEDSAIVGAVISLADALGLSAVAEGVETPGQAELLRRLGCPLAQGYFFAPPQRPEALAERFTLDSPIAVRSSTRLLASGTPGTRR